MADGLNFKSQNIDSNTAAYIVCYEHKFLKLYAYLCMFLSHNKTRRYPQLLSTTTIQNISVCFLRKKKLLKQNRFNAQNVWNVCTSRAFKTLSSILAKILSYTRYIILIKINSYVNMDDNGLWKKMIMWQTTTNF